MSCCSHSLHSSLISPTSGLCSSVHRTHHCRNTTSLGHLTSRTFPLGQIPGHHCGACSGIVVLFGRLCVPSSFVGRIDFLNTFPVGHPVLFGLGAVRTRSTTVSGSRRTWTRRSTGRCSTSSRSVHRSEGLTVQLAQRTGHVHWVLPKTSSATTST